MTDPLVFPERADARLVWVFTAALPDDTLDDFTARTDAGWPLGEALGITALEPEFIEAFPPQDIAEYGLVRYLTEANGMDPDQVSADAAKLGALTKPVVLVYSQALSGQQGRFDPKPPLSFVGRYEAPYSLSPSMPLPEFESASGVVTGPSGPSSDTPRMRRALVLTVLALALLAVLVWGLA
jgi:hypothetical protein